MAAESAVRIIFLGDSSSAVRSVSRLEGSFSTLGRTSKLLAGAIGVALVGGLVLATKEAINFQKQMELIHTQAGASTKEVERMSKALLGLAASVGTGPEELAKGLFHIESAGIRGANALSILKAAAEGAKVGQADLETVTNALIGAFKSGVKGVDSMQQAMGVLNAIVGAGNMRMNDLTSAMGTGLLSAAKGVGISFQDVGAALAELTVQNENASEASTRLQMAFLTMAAGTSKGDAALKSIGITQNKLALDMRSQGLIFALQDLQTHLQNSGKTAVEQTAIIADVFGRRSLKAILPLLQHLDDVRKRQEQINKTTANFGDAWVATQQTVSFQMERAKAALQAAFIPIGTLMLPLVSRLAQAVGDAAQFITAHMGQIQAVAGVAARAIGQAWDQYATPALRSFGGEVRKMAGEVQQNWSRIRAEALGTGAAIRSTMHSVGQILQDLRPILHALGPEFKIAFGLALIAVRTFVENVATGMRVIAVAVHTVAPVVAFMVRSFNTGAANTIAALKSIASAVRAAFNAVLGVIKAVLHGLAQLAGAVKTAFDIGPIGSFIGAIENVISAVQTLIGWISKIHFPSAPSGGPATSGGTKPGQPRGPKGGRAHGGFIPGPSGAPVQILAHAGEVVLNRAQQEAIGGPGAIASMFGFRGDAGPGFADGGFVGRHKPHHGHPVRSRYKTASRRARTALKGVDHINQQEEDADRAYGQLSRQYQIDGTLDPGEIDSLIAARQHMLDLLAEEKAALLKAIKDLRKAIKLMAAQLKTERAKKKPNSTRISNLSSMMSDFQRSIGDENLNLRHQLPFDVRDVQLDIADLQQQRAGAVTAGGPDVQALLDQIARLNLALGIQSAQSAVIGSFAKGTLSVPETGLALVHAGEQIVPAGRTRGGDGGSVGDIQVNLTLSGPLEPLAQFITATVDTPQMADKISVRVGQQASQRARSGRF